MPQLTTAGLGGWGLIPLLLLKGSVVGDLLRRLLLWDGPEKHPLWPLSIAIVVYIYVGTSSKKRCECLERLMNMNTTTRKSQYTIKLRYPRSRKKRVLNPDSRASICSGWKMKGGFHLMKCNVVDLLPFRPNYLFVPFLISELILGLVYYHRVNFSPSPSTINMMWKVCELVIFWD